MDNFGTTQPRKSLKLLQHISSKSRPSEQHPLLLNSEQGYLAFKRRNSLKYLPCANTRSDGVLRINSPNIPKDEKNIDYEGLKDIVPKWMLDRPDFKDFYVKSNEIENMDLEKVVNLPSEARDQLEKRLLLGWLISKEYFKTLPKNINREICARLICRVARRDETSNIYLVICEGSKADFLYIIYKGTVGVYVNNLKVASNKEGDVFGDVAVHLNSTRKADVIAESERVILFSISDVDYRNILFTYKTYEKKKFCRFVSLISFFSHWSLNKIQHFSGSLIKVEYKTGDIIYEFSDFSQVFYIIRSGKVEIQTFIDIEESNRWPVNCHEWNTRKVMTKYVYPIKVLETNNFFGQFEILRKTTRETRAVALEDTVCLSLNKADFESFIKDKDLKILENLNESYLPSQKEMEKTARKNIKAVNKNKQILMEAMQINYLPVGKNCLVETRSKKLKKWVNSVENRKKDEAKQIEERIVSRCLTQSEKSETHRRCSKNGHKIELEMQKEQERCKSEINSPTFNKLEKRVTMAPAKIKDRGFSLLYSPDSIKSRKSHIFR